MTTHGHLYRLIVSADPESAKVPLEIHTPSSPCVSPSTTHFPMFTYGSKPPQPPPTHALAGVDDLLTKCHDFGRRMSALYEAGAVAGRMSTVFPRHVQHLT